MKCIMIAGRLGSAAVLRSTQSGDRVLGFSVAVDDGWGENKRTLWFDCSVWGKRAESLDKLGLGKGTAVAVSGDLSTREHEGRTYLTIRAADVTLMGGGQDRGERRDEPARQSAGHGAEMDDDIPFAPEWRG